MSTDLKKRTVKALVWSVAHYGSETWILRKDVKRIYAFEMWIWRKMEKTSWTAHVSNEEVSVWYRNNVLWSTSSSYVKPTG